MATGQTYTNSKGQTVDTSTGQVVGGGNQGLGTASPTSYGTSAPSTNLNTIQTGITQAQQQAQAIQQQISQMQPSAPTNVNQVQPTGSVNMPSGAPKTVGTDGVGGLVSFYTDLFKTYDTQQKDIQAQRDAAVKTQTEQTKGFLDTLMKSKSPTQVRTDAEAETGIAPKEYFAEQKASIAEIDSLNKEYAGLVAQRDEQIAALEGQGRGIPLDLLDNQRARIERNAAPRINQVTANINSKAAVLEASQGRFAEAQKYVQSAVDASTEELNYTFKLFQTFYDINQDSIARLDTKYQDAFKGALGAAEAAYTTAYDEKNRIGELMLKYPNAGISINDSQDEALLKATKVAGVSDSKDTQVVTLGNGRTVLINKTTGEIVKDYGGAPTSSGVISEVTGKPLSEGERVSLGYANRAQTSSSIIDSIGEQFTGVSSYLGQYFPNAIKSSERQQFEQAQRDFVNAVLRRESGAAISETEFDNSRKQYFPQPGDSTEVLEQKAINRKNTINSLKLSGGSVEQSQGSVVVMTGPDGQLWNVPSDKVEQFKQNGYK